MFHPSPWPLYVSKMLLDVFPGGHVLGPAALHQSAFHSIPGVSVDLSVLLDAPLLSELIEDSEVELRARQS